MQLNLPAVDVTIDAHAYSIQTLDAITARRVWLALFKALGPALSAADAKGGSGEAMALRLIGAGLEALSPETINMISDIFAKACTVEVNGKAVGVESVFRWHFAAKPRHYIQWLIACCKVNFADFLDGSFNLASLTSPAAALASPSPSS